MSSNLPLSIVVMAQWVL